MKFYILRDRHPVPVRDLELWATFMMSEDRTVELSTINEVTVSTVFLGFDHSFGFGPLQLFETMIFGGARDGYQRRSPTWEIAETEHRKAVLLLSH